MGLLPILSVFDTVTIGTMLNFNSGNKGHGVKNLTCKQTFTLTYHFHYRSITTHHNERKYSILEKARINLEEM